MPAPMKDEFASLPISRQQRYQLRKRRDGNCIRCGGSAVDANFCEDHRRKFNVLVREQQRRRAGYVRRNFNAESYYYESIMNHPLQQHQRAFLNWLRLSEPQFPVLASFFAIPHGGLRTRSKSSGLYEEVVKRGVLGTFLQPSRDGLPGLWIEFKANGQRLPSDQSAWKIFLKGKGYEVHFVRNWVEAARVTLGYLAMSHNLSRNTP